MNFYQWMEGMKVTLGRFFCFFFVLSEGEVEVLNQMSKQNTGV